MAGIEKICEFSGDDGSYDMYSYKRNYIQVMPKYRKLFAKAEHTIHVFKPTQYFQYKKSSSMYEVLENLMYHYIPPFENMKDLIDYKLEFENVRIINKYDYVLEVKDEKLKGKVNGLYLNYSIDFGVLKRKMKRLLKCKKLNIVMCDCSYSEWRKMNKVN
jgi:hypothetical protein